MTRKRIVIKIGSNVLTRPDKTLDVTRMSALVDQISDLHRAGYEVVMVSSGAVASGRSELRGCIDADQLDPVSARQLFSAVGQVKLISHYHDLFRDQGIVCGQVLTMKESFSTREHYLTQKQCIEVMLSRGVVPIVNENDTVSLTELMFTDNDELSGIIASMLSASELIILSNIDGVYDGDPSLPTSKVILDINPDDEIDSDNIIQKTKSSLGRGGMGSKYHISETVAQIGINVVIANGKRENILRNIISDDRTVPYTIFHAAAKSTTSVKKWIAYSGDFAKGTITVNECAYNIFTQQDKAISLLPVGVIAISGDFEKNDIVRILSPQGQMFAIGRASTSSAEARKHLGQKGGKPIVHYDYLYIYK